MESAKAVAEFVAKYGWFIPWSIPEQYQAQLHELADEIAKAAGKFPADWSRPTT
jgi:hypothetical protein